MPRNFVYLSHKNEDIISFEKFSSYGTNDADLRKMKTILSKAIHNELTQRQRICLLSYFYDGKKIEDIADDLNISKSTVSRHIKAAKKNLQRVAMYY